MERQPPVVLVGVGVLAMGGALFLAGLGWAEDDDTARKGILKVADAIAKGKNAEASNNAKALAKKIDGIDEVMNLMRPRKKGGKGDLGVGDKPGATAPLPDGIELILHAMGRDAPSQQATEKHAAALEKMAHVVAAIAEVSIASPDKKRPKEWVRYAKEMKEAAPKLAEAAKSKSPAELKKAAAQINAACNRCHSDFKK